MTQRLALILLLGAPGVAAATPFYAAVPLGGSGTAGIHALDDLNGDGDALDAGERWIYRDSTGAGTLTKAGFFDVAVSTTGAVYAVDLKGDRIYRMEDLDGDGKAQGALEISVFYASVGLNASRITSLAVTSVWDEVAGRLRDGVYGFDPLGQRVYRYIDWSGDGRIDEEDPQEVRAFHTLSPGQPFTAQRLHGGAFDTLFGALPNDDAVARLWSADGDGALDPDIDETADNCVLGDGPDAKEHVVVARDSQLLNQAFGITQRGDVYYVSVPPTNGQDVGRIVRLKDADGDETYYDTSETAHWAQLLCTSLSTSALLRKPTDLLALPSGRVVIGDLQEGRFLWWQDLNGDGDADDGGECGQYGANLAGVTGLARSAGLPEGVDMLLSGAAVSDEGKGPQIFVPHGAGEVATLTTTLKGSGAVAGSVPVRCDVLEGCLTCTPRVDKTSGAGTLVITVKHGGLAPTTASGDLVLTGPSGEKTFFEAVWPILDVKDTAGLNLTHIDFGAVTVGATASATLLIGNAGSAAMTGTAAVDSGAFGVSDGAVNVASPAAAQVLEVTFAPPEVGTFSGTLSFVTDGGTLDLFIEGEGVTGGGSGCGSRESLPALLLLPLFALFGRRRKDGKS